MARQVWTGVVLALVAPEAANLAVLKSKRLEIFCPWGCEQAGAVHTLQRFGRRAGIRSTYDVGLEQSRTARRPATTGDGESRLGATAPDSVKSEFESQTGVSGVQKLISARE